ncbi:helix-turn-helix domain-containing protein [Nocardioides stalactiti]|uniref:helix-turn-helix domain-containing protein n=1 Tax=Nocardioides stalactiti TaxID=2755356 RepID=UPI0015FF2FD5|nr:helix-turn-helix domain-containing protein [Nocardioides stalactiti]
MKMHTTTVELATRDQLTDDQLDQLMTNLSTLHPAIGTSARGWLEVTVTLPAEHVGQAVTLAVAAIEQAAGHPTVAVTSMTEAEADAREGWEDSPSDLVSVSQAAEILGVSRQAVLDRISRHTLPAEKVGKGYTIPRAALTSKADGFATLQTAIRNLAERQPQVGTAENLKALREINASLALAKARPQANAEFLEALKKISKTLATMNAIVPDEHRTT